MFNKDAVIAKGGIFNIMYPLGSRIVELETARRRLLYIFEVPDATLRSGLRTQLIPDGPLRTQLIPDGPHSIGLLTRLKTPLDP